MLFGLLFPIAATVLLCFQYEMPINFISLLQAQRRNFSIWIIDTAPIFIGFFAYLIGLRENKLVKQSNNLDKIVLQRSGEILKQKLYYESLFRNIPSAVVTLDENHRIMAINPSFEKLFGYSINEIKGKDLDTIISDEDHISEAKSYTNKALSGETIHGIGKRRKKDGSWVIVEIIGEPIMLEGKRIGVLGLYNDITERKKAEDTIRQSEARYRGLFNDSPISLWEVDFSRLKSWVSESQNSGIKDLYTYLSQMPNLYEKFASNIDILDANQSTLQLFGANNVEHLKQNFYKIFTKDSNDGIQKIITALSNGKHILETELPHQTLGGKLIYTIVRLSIIPGYEENWSHVHVSILDISKRKRAEVRLKFLSLHDALTNLYNRAYFDTEMQRLTNSRLYPISIILLDMDNLKLINDTLGHSSGDRAIKRTANLIKSSSRSEDIVARVGGDEFAILLQNMSHELAQSILKRMEHIIQEHNHKYKKDDLDHRINVSAGLATAVEGESISETYKLADARMYQVKRRKKVN